MVAAVRPESDWVEVVDEREHDCRPVLNRLAALGPVERQYGHGVRLTADDWRNISGLKNASLSLIMSDRSLLIGNRCSNIWAWHISWRES